MEDALATTFRARWIVTGEWDAPTTARAFRRRWCDTETWNVAILALETDCDWNLNLGQAKLRVCTEID
jgi:hypothetical protein